MIELSKTFKILFMKKNNGVGGGGGFVKSEEYSTKNKYDQVQHFQSKVFILMMMSVLINYNYHLAC